MNFLILGSGAREYAIAKRINKDKDRGDKIHCVGSSENYGMTLMGIKTLVSSDSDFTRLATRLREAGMQVIGIGEKKTPKPFIVACDKFIYLEILKPKSEKSSTAAGAENSNVDKITDNEIKLIASSIDDLSDDDGWAFLGDVGSLLQKKQPNFDSRNYGFAKLTPLIQSTGKFDLEQREGSNTRYKLIYVKNKEVGRRKAKTTKK